MKLKPLAIVVVSLIGGCGSSSEDEQISPRTFMRLTCSTDLTADETVDRLRSHSNIAGEIVTTNGITPHPFGKLITVDGGRTQAPSLKIELVFIDDSEAVFVDAKKVGQPTTGDWEIVDSLMEYASIVDCFTVVD
ncbi:MAG: hypothetical protein ABIQ46_00865 [Alteraurantiacibacter sp.]